MAGTFAMYAAVVGAHGRAERLPEPGAVFTMRAPNILELFDRVDSRLNRSGAKTSFPWFFSRHAGVDPSPIDTASEKGFRPKLVLESLQLLERELQRNSQRYPSVCQFWTGSGVERSARPTLEVWYRGRPCRLYSDDKGCWAVETTPGPREGIHHDLKDMGEVVVRLSETGPETSVAIERTSFLAQWSEAIAAMKRVCLVAMQAGGWVVVGGE